MWKNKLMKTTNEKIILQICCNIIFIISIGQAVTEPIHTKGEGKQILLPDGGMTNLQCEPMWDMGDITVTVFRKYNLPLS